MMPSVDIIIVNWNTGSQLQACLASIAGADRTALVVNRVVIVDNASSDGSTSGIQADALPMEIIRNDENRGFAAACNQGAGGAQADYLLFLNPDTRLFRDSLTRPVGFMEQADNRMVGICGVRLTGDDGSTVVSCARFPTAATFFAQATGLSHLAPRLMRPHLMSPEECRTTREVDQVIGAFFLVRRTLFEDLGGFDERFFVYFEEVDFSLRARRHGYRSIYLADVAIYHRGGVSSEQVKGLRLFYSLRSRLLYGFKHYNWLGAAFLISTTVGIEFIARVARAAAHGSGRELTHVIGGYAALANYGRRRAWAFLTKKSSADSSVPRRSEL